MTEELFTRNPFTGEEKYIGRGRWIPQEQLDAMVRKNAKIENEKRQGEFIWVLFDYCEEVFPDMSCPSMARLFYLATFIEYDGDRLTVDGGYTFMGKRQVKQRLNITDKAFTDFWNDMTYRKILAIDQEGHVVINTTLFRRGSIDKRCKRDFTRIYCECVQYIYENCTNIRDHGKLAYIFKIIPYVNRKTNIVCYNPEELDNQKIIPMTTGDFCNSIGYNKANATRLFKDLAKFTVRGRHLFCYVSIDSFNLSGMYIIMNPEIYYGGAEQHNAKFLFEVCDKKTV